MVRPDVGIGHEFPTAAFVDVTRPTYPGRPRIRQRSAALRRYRGRRRTSTSPSRQRSPRWRRNFLTRDPMQTQTASVQAPADREQLIMDHLPQVRLIARRIHERLPGSVSLDDLVSTGIVGLISAIDNFDPRLNVKLKTYAEYKIRGAILDSLRGMDWAPRQQRKRVKMIEAAIASLEQRNHRSPSEDEIARELGLSTEEYHDWLIDVRGVNLGSLEGNAPEEEGRDLLRFVSDSEDLWPSRIVERAELERLLAVAIDKMPYVERTVLGLYYHEELTLREIAKVVKLHESRVSQLKSQAILRLRAYLEKRWPMDRGI